MTPRPDIVAIPVTASLADLRNLFREEQYSRVPVYRDTLDNVVGIVFVKDLVSLPPGAAPPLMTMNSLVMHLPPGVGNLSTRNTISCTAMPAHRIAGALEDVAIAFHP